MLIKMECPILFSAPYFLFRSAAAEELTLNDSKEAGKGFLAIDA